MCRFTCGAQSTGDAEIVIGSDFVHELMTPRTPFHHGYRLLPSLANYSELDASGSCLDEPFTSPKGVTLRGIVANVAKDDALSIWIVDCVLIAQKCSE